MYLGLNQKEWLTFGELYSLNKSKSIDITKKKLDLITSLDESKAWVRISTPSFS